MGFSLKEFYCCGKLKSVSLSLGPNEHNHFGKSHNKNDCCKNKFQFHKVKDGHLASVSLINSFGNFSFISNPDYNRNVRLCFALQGRSESIHSPPAFNGVAAYITNCVFRI